MFAYPAARARAMSFQSGEHRRILDSHCVVISWLALTYRRSSLITARLPSRKTTTTPKLITSASAGSLFFGEALPVTGMMAVFTLVGTTVVLDGGAVVLANESGGGGCVLLSGRLKVGVAAGGGSVGERRKAVAAAGVWGVTVNVEVKMMRVGKKVGEETLEGRSTGVRVGEGVLVGGTVGEAVNVGGMVGGGVGVCVVVGGMVLVSVGKLVSEGVRVQRGMGVSVAEGPVCANTGGIPIPLNTISMTSNTD
jgi:hypothetical protein